MSFNSMWSRSNRGRHKDRRRSKWLRLRDKGEQELEMNQSDGGEERQRGK